MHWNGSLFGRKQRSCNCVHFQVKSSKEGSLNTVGDVHTPPTPRSSASDSTESSKPSQSGVNNNSVPEDTANGGPSTNGMVKTR